jgi:hypothetical protein
LHAVAELAWRLHPDPAGPADRQRQRRPRRLIDWLLVNDAMLPHLDAASYRVHIPTPARPRLSDHRLVTASIEL